MDALVPSQESASPSRISNLTCPNPQCPNRDQLRSEQHRCLKLLSANDVLQQAQQYLIDKCASLTDELSASGVEAEATRRQMEGIETELHSTQTDLFHLKRQHETVAESSARTEQMVASLQQRLSAAHRENVLLRDQVLFLQKSLNDMTSAKLRTVTPPRQRGNEESRGGSTASAAAPMTVALTPVALRSPQTQEHHLLSTERNGSTTYPQNSNVQRWIAPMQRAIEDMQATTASVVSGGTVLRQPHSITALRDGDEQDSVRSVPQAAQSEEQQSVVVHVADQQQPQQQGKRESPTQRRWPSASRRRSASPVTATVQELVHRYEHPTSPQPMAYPRHTAASWIYQKAYEPIRRSLTQEDSNERQEDREGEEQVQEEEESSPPPPPPPVEEDEDSSPRRTSRLSPTSADKGTSDRKLSVVHYDPLMPQAGAPSSFGMGYVWDAMRTNSISGGGAAASSGSMPTPYVSTGPGHHQVASKSTSQRQLSPRRQTEDTRGSPNHMIPQPTPSNVSLSVHSLPSLRPLDHHYPHNRNYGSGGVGPGGAGSRVGFSNSSSAVLEAPPQFFEFE